MSQVGRPRGACEGLAVARTVRGPGAAGGRLGGGHGHVGDCSSSVSALPLTCSRSFVFRD